MTEKMEQQFGEKLTEFEYKKLDENKVKFEIEQSREKEKNKKFILEIGCGNKPFFAKADREIKKNEHYVGIEISKEHISAGKKIVLDNNLVKGKVDFFLASGEKIPFKDESVNEVIIRDVLGDPSSVYVEKIEDFDSDDPQKIGIGISHLAKERKEFKNLKNKKFNELDEMDQELIRVYYYDFLRNKRERIRSQIKKAFIDESYRVLKDDGELIVIETRTPDVAKEYIDKIKTDRRFEVIENKYDIKDFLSKYHAEGSQYLITLAKKKLGETKINNP